MCDDPVFVLCAARSGSTLLRFVLDAHPDLACPPETKLPAVCAQLTGLWALLEGETLPAEPVIGAELVPTLPDIAITGARRALDDMIAGYLARRGKKRFCDKSLAVAPHVPLLLRLFPGAKFLCLYRHPMDLIASGIEACPWGLNGFGFDPYAAASPGNSVQALAQFWADYATAILGAEESHPDRCHRVRYEDLAADPEATADAIFAFLGVPSAPGISRDCLAPGRETHGPADFKIWNTSEITTASVGRGWTVPASQISPATRDTVNALCAKLGYLPVGPDWGLTPQAPNPRMSGVLPRCLGDAPAVGSPARNAPANAAAPGNPGVPGSPQTLDSPAAPGAHGGVDNPDVPAPGRVLLPTLARTGGLLLPLAQRKLGVTLADGLARLAATGDTGFRSRWGQFAGERFLLCATAPGGGLAVRWLVDLPARTMRVAPSVPTADTRIAQWEIMAPPDVWDKALRRDLSIGMAIHRRDMRYYEASPGLSGAVRLRTGLLAELLGITGWPAPEADTARNPQAAGALAAAEPPAARDAAAAEAAASCEIAVATALRLLPCRLPGHVQPGGGPELPQDARHVGVHSSLGHEQLGRDARIGRAAPDQRRDPQLGRGQRRPPGRGAGVRAPGTPPDAVRAQPRVRPPGVPRRAEPGVDPHRGRQRRAGGRRVARGAQPGRGLLEG
jgi:hypothetical protein